MWALGSYAHEGGRQGDEGKAEAAPDAVAHSC